MRDFTASSNWRDVTSIASGFNSTLANIVEWFVYVRSDRRFRCMTCYDAASGDILRNCVECLGTGFASTASIVPGHIVSAVSNFEGTFLENVGLYTKNTTFIDLPRSVYPANQDLMFRVTWNCPVADIPTSNDVYPIDLIQFNRIEYISNYYQSQIVFFKAQLVEQNDQKEFYRQLLPTLRNMPVVQIG